MTLYRPYLLLSLISHLLIFFTLVSPSAYKTGRKRTKCQKKRRRLQNISCFYVFLHWHFSRTDPSMPLTQGDRAKNTRRQLTSYLRVFVNTPVWVIVKILTLCIRLRWFLSLFLRKVQRLIRSLQTSLRPNPIRTGTGPQFFRDFSVYCLMTLYSMATDCAWPDSADQY